MAQQPAENIVHTEYSTPYRRVLSASILAKDTVYNRSDQNVGSIKDIMIDVPSGRVAYAVLAVGGFLGIGERLFAIPWRSLVLDEDRKCFIFDVDRSRLENAPGFDQSHWPDMADPAWGLGVSKYWTDRGDSGRDDYGVEAGRRYDRATAADSGPGVEAEARVFNAAREAREAIDGPEGASLRRAEQIGKDRSEL